MKITRIDLVRLVTADGIEGYSAVQSMGPELAGLGKLLGSYLLGERADDIPGIRQRIREMGYLGWRMAVIADAPKWDLARATRFCQAAGEARLAARSKVLDAAMANGQNAADIALE